MLIAMLLLVAAGTGHAEERISVPSINVEPGTQSEIVINCEFTNENITLYQFDLYLPEGFTPAYDADEEDWVYTLSSRHKKSHQFAMTNNGSFYRVVVSSNTNKLIASGTGELLRITVDVAETVTGTHRATIKQFSMFETDETEHPMADYSFNLVAPSAVIHVEDISVNPTNITLTPENNTVQLNTIVTPGNATDKSVRWESNNTPVATVDDNGLVTAISTGTAIVTAHTNDGNFAASCTVTVDFPPAKEYISVADVNVEPDSRAEIAIDCEFSNENMTLYQFDLYLPEGFTPAYDADEEDWVYTLSSRHKKNHQFAMTDNGSFYRVVVSSNTNKLIASGTGELLRITVDVAGSVSGTQQAAIRNFSMFETDETEHPMADYSFNLVASSAVIPVKDISVNPTSITLTSENNTVQLRATVLPEDASNKGVTWTSSDPSVATVDENGLVNAVAAGIATITATTTDGTNLEASCAVTVVRQPIYIETDVTSQFPTDWQGWNGATGYTSTEFAPIVSTNDGRQVQVCEKFDGGSATEGTVFKRTLTGLTNGTYRIELYGAASSTKGRDVNIISDMTEGNEGDETAVYLYATTPAGTVSQYIPVHWATSFTEIATAVLNEVEVTDGTIEIGMYSEKKYTNWHVVQIKGVTALVDIEELHANTLDRARATLRDEAYAIVTGEERTALSQAIADNTSVSGHTTAAYQAAISALENAIKTVTDAKVGYDDLAATKSLVSGRSYPYATEAKRYAAEEAAYAVATSAADAVSKAEALLTAYRQYAESSAMLEGVNGAEDVTATYIKNPRAEEAIDATVWQTILGEGSGGGIGFRDDQPWTDGSGSTAHRYFDGGQYNNSSWDVSFKQDITLPAGRYQLTAMGRSSQNVAITLFAGEATAEMAHNGNSGGLFNNGWEQTSVEFELREPATVSIGVRGVTSILHNWMSFSGFRLLEFPIGMTGIREMNSGERRAESEEWGGVYDLSGRHLNNGQLPKGVYIINGRKMLVK